MSAKDTHIMRLGDTLPVLRARASYKDDSGVTQYFNFDGWTLTFTATGTVTITGSGDGTVDGYLTYEWQSGDTTVAGSYQGKFVGIAPTGETQTFPTQGYVTVQIVE